jgi:DsbC/DsbD-like thiol-disulfide interchange protein
MVSATLADVMGDRMGGVEGVDLTLLKKEGTKMTIRHSIFLMIAMAVCLLAIGCNDNGAGKAREERAASAAREQAERLRREEAERARKVAEEAVKLEQERRLQAEKQAKEAAAAKWTWIVPASALCLIIGVAISSKTKKDYAEQREELQHRDNPAFGRDG